MRRVKLNIKILIVIIAIPLVFFSVIISQSNDADTDKVIDNYPNTINPNQEDLDADNLGNTYDLDGDGILDIMDAFAQNPEEWDDFDSDGIGANEDEDDDNDGILDINDASPSHPSTQLYKKYRDLIDDCVIMDPDSRNLCLKNTLVSLVNKGEDGFEVISFSVFFDELRLINDCHHIAHHVGFITFQENLDLYETLINAEHICRSGFHHGLISGFFDDLKNKEEDFSSVYKTLCGKFVDKKDIYDCIHGIGHGLVFYYEDDLRQSVDACHELPDESQISGESPPLLICLQGLFMQHVDDELTKSTSFEEDIPEICSKIEMTPLDIRLCYHMIGKMITFETNYNLDSSFNFCNVIKDQEGRSGCYNGVMNEFYGSKELSKCDLIDDLSEIRVCYENFLMDELIRTHPLLN